MDDIDTVKNIVNLGRSIRNKANIKIRQPLQDIKIFISDISSSMKKYDYQILEELNIKKIQYVDNAEEIVKYNVKPNFTTINQDFGDQKSDIISKINSLDSAYIIKILETDKCILINDNKLNHGYFIIEEIPFDGYCSSSNKNLVASINIELTKDLINEGIVRDLIRKIQNLRKDSDFKVNDRIDVYISSNSEIDQAISKNKDYLKNEVLALNLNTDSYSGEHKIEFLINNVKVHLGISINNK
jgi:isoleucyl-tRNA synthetase